MADVLEMSAPPTSPASVPGTELTVPQSTQPSAPPLPDAARQAIIDRYQNLYGAPPEPAAPPAAQPQATPPAQPVQATPDLGGIVNSLVSEVTALKEQLAAAKGQQAPAAPAPVAVSPAEEADWLRYLAEGKKEQGEALLAAKVKSIVGDGLEQAAVEKTLALIDAQSFANKVRTDNPDLLPMEQYITAAAQQRIMAAQAAGKIKTPGDYVTVYKDAVNTEIAAARQLILSFRGEGRQEGLTRQAQVLASPSLQPSQVDTQRQTAAVPTEEPVQTPSDYLAMRQANKARGQGL